MDNLVNELAQHLQPLFDKWPGSKSYGLAELVQRGNQTLPAIGEQYVGPDDKAPVIAYHRVGAITSAASANVAGRSYDIVNTYNLSLVVYMDKKRTGLSAGELFLFMQANMPDSLIVSNYTEKVIVAFTGAILNSRTVFNSEFPGGTLEMPFEKTMFQINYTLRAQFNKNCYRECPC